MTHYAHGVRVEYLVRDDLISCGWEVVRAAGSKGGADLVAIGDGEIAFLSVKRTTSTIPPDERHRLIALADRVGPLGLPLVASKPSRQPLTYRLLTGPGARDWMTWEPTQGEAA